MEALAKPDTEISEDYDFWNAARNLKAPNVKFCNAFKNRVRITLAEYRVICEDESQAPLRVLGASFLTGKVGLL